MNAVRINTFWIPACAGMTMIMVAASGLAFAADAQYPLRPIRMIVPNATGASSDVLGRIVAMQLSAEFGQQVIVDNRPGAGSRTRAVNRVPACGM